jgi:uncharacterized membrane protein
MSLITIIFLAFIALYTAFFGVFFMFGLLDLAGKKNNELGIELSKILISLFSLLYFCFILYLITNKLILI